MHVDAKISKGNLILRALTDRAPSTAEIVFDLYCPAEFGLKLCPRNGVAAHIVVAIAVADLFQTAGILQVEFVASNERALLIPGYKIEVARLGNSTCLSTDWNQQCDRREKGVSERHGTNVLFATTATYICRAWS